MGSGRSSGGRYSRPPETGLDDKRGGRDTVWRRPSMGREVADSNERPEPEALANRRRRAAVVLIVALLLGGGWWLTSARSLGHYGFDLRADLEIGDQLHIGFPAFVDQDLSVISLRADLSEGLEGEFHVCHPRQGADVVGLVPDLDPSCSQVDQAGRGTSLAADRPEADRVPYLVLSLTATAPGEQWLCGIDVMYRSGVRFGWQRDVPVRGMLNAAEDAEPHCG